MIANSLPLNPGGYVGTRALFDPEFVPPRLPGREKEVKRLRGFLTDMTEDHCATNVVVTGIPGIGKKALVNATIPAEAPIVRKIDCSNKIIEEILGTMVASLTGADLGPFHLLNASIPQLWNTLRLACKKYRREPSLPRTRRDGSRGTRGPDGIQGPDATPRPDGNPHPDGTTATAQCPTFVLQSVNHVQDGYLEKFFRFGKECAVNVIATWESTALTRADLPSRYSDYRVNLTPVQSKDLYEIARDRLELALPGTVPASVPAIVVDLVDEFSIRAPGACINILKDVYPALKNEESLSFELVRDACKYHFSSPDFLPNELQLLHDVGDADFLLKMFIDEIAALFGRPGKFYASHQELRERYAVACEVVDVPKNTREFWDFVSILKGMNVLYHSRLNHGQYYLLPTPPELQRILDVLFTGP